MLIMSRALHVVPTPRSPRADLSLTVQVDESSVISAQRFGDHMELTVSDPLGRTVVTLDFPDEDFRRLILAMTDATQKKVRK